MPLQRGKLAREVAVVVLAGHVQLELSARALIGPARSKRTKARTIRTCACEIENAEKGERTEKPSITALTTSVWRTMKSEVNFMNGSLSKTSTRLAIF